MTDSPSVDAETDRARPPWIWLSLSGGGFRAALFHYGCFKRLHELGLLQRVHAMSATSGGALVAALFATTIRGLTPDRRGNQYDWNVFETKLLTAAMRGILGPSMLLALIRVLYIVGL